MTDYLSERLDHSNYLLEQMEQAERRVSGLTAKSIGEEAENEKLWSGGSLFERWDSSKLEALKAVYNETIQADREQIVAERPGSAFDVREKGGTAAVGLFERVESEPKPVHQGENGPVSGDRQNVEALNTVWPVAEEPGLALTTQLERLEQAVSDRTEMGVSVGRKSEISSARTAGQPGEGRRFSLAGEYKTGQLAEDRFFPASFDVEQNWAERTDRAFQRDSRRYDGGFYLY